MININSYGFTDLSGILDWAVILKRETDH